MNYEQPEDFQARIGLRFSDQALLASSLTHSSYINEQPNQKTEHNERLEFLGDAVLDLLVGELLYKRIPDANEGHMTRLRAALVRTESLAELARKIRLGDALLMGRGEEESGGRSRAGNLCAAFEALIGAIFVDAGLDAARTFAIPLIQTKLDTVLQFELDRDPKSQLQEVCQSRWGSTPKYVTVSSTGPEHAKEFAVAVYVRGLLAGEGTGSSKQLAAQAAAERALDAVDKDLVNLGD